MNAADESETQFLISFDTEDEARDWQRYYARQLVSWGLTPSHRVGVRQKTTATGRCFQVYLVREG